MKNRLYRVEEFHRGKWIPILLKNDEPKTVRITEQTAEIMNMDSESIERINREAVKTDGKTVANPHFRYVLLDEKDTEVKGSDPLANKTVADFKKGDLQDLCDAREIEYEDEDTKAILWEKLNA